jgi:parallel beta-helix repeat protein
MRYFIGFLLIFSLIISLGCDKQTAPTSVDETKLTTQKPEVNREAPDLSLLRQQLEAKSKFIQEKVEEMNRQKPARSHPNSFAKVTGVIKVPGDYATIQEAVDAAGDGAVINVTGTFDENVWIDGKTNLKINGGHKATVTGQEPYYAPFIIRWSENVTIKGFNLIDMVFISETQGAIIKDNDISGLADGIEVLNGSSGCTIVGNTIHDKMPGGFGTGDGIFVSDSYDNHIRENHVYQNNAGSGWGILLVGGGNNTLQNNTSSNNWEGIACYFSNQNSIKDSKTTSNSDVGILLIQSSENEIKDNECCQNWFGILFDNCSNNLIKDAHCNDNYIGGIDFFGACLHNTIVGAVANNNVNWEGMYFDDGTANNTIKDSEAYGNGSCDVQDDGTDNIFINNHFGSFNCSL